MKMYKLPIYTSLFALLTSAACLPVEEDETGDMSSESDMENTPDSNNDPDMVPDMTVVAPSNGWTVNFHPCVGNRTDALHCDDDKTCFVGCGTTATGRGMFVTSDAGANWGKLTTEPEGFVDGSRVNDISRSADGKLYVAGEHNNGLRVVSIDDNGTVEPVFKKGDKVDFSFTAGSFRRNGDGRAIAESLTGSGIVYREQDDADALMSWQNGYGFWSDQVKGGVQILQLDEHDGSFYGAGSTIAQPPYVFLPAWDDAFGFEILSLVDPDSLGAFSGEMWGIDVNDDGIVVGGVNQSSARGMVYTFSFEDALSPSDRANWSSFSLSKLFPENTTWIQGVCRGEGGVIYAVGRESREGWGIVVRSTDNGANWEDISPYPQGGSKSSLEDAYRCHVTADGVFVAGAAGMFAVYKD